MKNPSILRNSKLNFLLGTICLLAQGFKEIVGGTGVSTGGGEGGCLEASCRALVRHLVGTLGTSFLLAKVFLGMILIETKNGTLEKEFWIEGIPLEKPRVSSEK